MMKHLLILMTFCMSALAVAESKQESRFIDIYISGVSYGSTARSTVDMENQGREDAKKLCKNHYGSSISEGIDIDCEDGYSASCKIKYSSNCRVRGFYTRKVKDFSVAIYEQDFELFSSVLQEVERDFKPRREKSSLTIAVAILVSEVDYYTMPRVSIDCPDGYNSVKETSGLSFCSHEKGISCQVRSSGICADRSYIKH